MTTKQETLYLGRVMKTHANAWSQTHKPRSNRCLALICTAFLKSLSRDYLDQILQQMSTWRALATPRNLAFYQLRGIYLTNYHLLGIMMRPLPKRVLSNMFKHQPDCLLDNHLNLRALSGGSCSKVSAISSNSRLRSYTIPTRYQTTSPITLKKTRTRYLRRMSRRKKKKTRRRVLLWSRVVVRKRRRTRN